MIKVIEKSKIKLKPILFKLNDPVSVNVLAESFDYTPFILITKLQNTQTTDTEFQTNIDTSDIIYLKLHNSKFLPEIELYCNDSRGIIFNNIYPYDRDVLISLFVKSNTNIITENQEGAPIRMDFRLTDHEIVKTDERRDKLNHLIKGILNVDELNYNYYECNNDTSYNVLKKLALKFNLGFASNISNSNDKMKWINPSESYISYIKSISDHAYVSDDSFIWTYIDFYYNLNYVDLQVELNDFAASRNRKDKVTNPQIIKGDVELEGPLYLTNNRMAKGSNKYINKFDLINQSYKVNLEKSYQMKTTWFNKKLNTIFKENIKELESDESKLASTDEGKLNQLVDKNSKIFTENINDEYFSGKIDIDNVHEKYIITHNTKNYNFTKLDKMKMVVIIPKINFFIRRFQIIRVEIYNIDDLFSKDALEKAPGSNINTVLSGYWIVTGINYLFRKSGGHEQEVTLERRDLGIDYGVNTQHIMGETVPKTENTLTDKKSQTSSINSKSSDINENISSASSGNSLNTSPNTKNLEKEINTDNNVLLRLQSYGANDDDIINLFKT